MSVEEFPCGLDVALAVVGGKWKPFIMYHIYPGPKRFGDLKRLIAGVSDKVLSQQLRELAVAGVLTRHDHKQVPPVVDYTITAFGITLARALMPLCEWGTVHRAQIAEIMPSLALRQADDPNNSADPKKPARP